MFQILIADDEPNIREGVRQFITRRCPEWQVVGAARDGKEALEMADAIDDLCSPTDNYGWASAGIYCFWDYYAEAVLYIGLAGDLAERFKQHNGILPIKEGSKQKQIEDYFSRNERLGYTIFV